MGYRPLPASYHDARRALPTLSRGATADVVRVVEHDWFPPLRITALSAPTLLDRVVSSYRRDARENARFACDLRVAVRARMPEDLGFLN